MIAVKRIDHMGSDADIVAAARQSTDGAFRGWGTEEKPGDEKLLRYMWEHRHSTPFEFCSLHVEVEAPIFVARQIFRHRTFSFSEVSGRYVEIGEDVYAPKVWRGQGKTNRQGSAEPLYEESQECAHEAYAEAVAMDFPAPGGEVAPTRSVRAPWCSAGVVVISAAFFGPTAATTNGCTSAAGLPRP